MKIRTLGFGLLLLAGGAGAALAQDKDEKKTKRDRNVITQQEITVTNVVNVLQAIRRLRSTWLASRGAISPTSMETKETSIGVFVDGAKRGQGFAELERIPLEQVAEIRFYPVETAVTKFGSSNTFGAIDVVTRR